MNETILTLNIKNNEWNFSLNFEVVQYQIKIYTDGKLAGHKDQDRILKYLGKSKTHQEI